MKAIAILYLLVFSSISLLAQLPPRVNPVIKSQGGVYEIPFSIENPDPALKYNIVIEVERESDKPDTINWALNNVARFLNLLSVGGVPAANVNVVLAIHGGASYSAMNNEQYRDRYKVNNPNLTLYQELHKAGVKMYLCGQSIVNRKIDRSKLVEEVKPALSMLTVVTTYQLKGYAYLRF